MTDFNEPRMAWSGTCDSCYAIVVVAANYETEDEDRRLIAEGPSDWNTFPSCYVCDGTIDWIGSDPVSSVMVR